MSAYLATVIPKPLFSLGQVVATPAALDFINSSPIDPAVLLLKHQVGDWSCMSTEDALANLDAVLRGGRVFSSFTFADRKIWVITEADRSLTTILLPEDY